MLAVINPVVCGIILFQIQKDNDKRKLLKNAFNSMLSVLIILLISAISGNFILHAYGISMDAFKIIGGVILAFIGITMMSARKNYEFTDPDGNPLNEVILFAASSGTIAMTITLCSINESHKFPVITMISTFIAVLISLGTIVLMIYYGSNKKAFQKQSIISKFMGLIVVSIRLQFMLEGIKNFFTL